MNNTVKSIGLVATAFLVAITTANAHATINDTQPRMQIRDLEDMSTEIVIIKNGTEERVAGFENMREAIAALASAYTDASDIKQNQLLQELVVIGTKAIASQQLLTQSIMQLADTLQEVNATQ